MSIIYNSITSRSNEFIINTGKLNERKYREAEKKFLVCGRKLAFEAARAEIGILSVIVTPDFRASFPQLCQALEEKYPNAVFYEVLPYVLCKLTNESSPEGIICVCSHIDKTEKINKIYNMLSDNRADFVMLCDRMADPGNLGAVLRSAAAFGNVPVLLGEGCADLYSQKTLRGSMGAAFFTDCAEQVNIISSIEKLHSLGFTVYATALHRDAVSLREIDLKQKIAFVIGNEGSGLPDGIISVCDRCAVIPMRDGAESLNASVAASVILWEKYRNS